MKGINLLVCTKVIFIINLRTIYVSSPIYQSTERGNEDVTMAGIGGLMSLTPVIGWTLERRN